VEPLVPQLNKNATGLIYSPQFLPFLGVETLKGAKPPYGIEQATLRFPPFTKRWSQKWLPIWVLQLHHFHEFSNIEIRMLSQLSYRGVVTNLD